MKIFILILSFLLSVSNFLYADALKSISLTEECEGSTCKPHTWWLTDSFSPEFLGGKTDSPIWKEVNEFPVWMNK